MEDSNLYGWVFIQNLNGQWCAAKREYYWELFNGDKGNVLRSSSIDTLTELIRKTDGETKEINKLLQ